MQLPFLKVVWKVVVKPEKNNETVIVVFCKEKNIFVSILMQMRCPTWSVAASRAAPVYPWLVQPGILNDIMSQKSRSKLITVIMTVHLAKIYNDVM